MARLETSLVTCMGRSVVSKMARQKFLAKAEAGMVGQTYHIDTAVSGDGNDRLKGTEIDTCGERREQC